jgi:RNA polymerase sigma-70 factor (ECF subfamily)
MSEQSRFLRLFLQGEGDLRAFVGSLIRNRQDRDDVFQDIVVVLWEKFGEYRADESFGAWARGVAVNKVRQYWQRSKRQMAPLSPAAIDALADAFGRLEQPRAAALDALEECMRRVPQKSIQLLRLRYDDALSMEKIATSSGTGVAAVYKALARLRSRLRDCVERRLLARGQ